MADASANVEDTTQERSWEPIVTDGKSEGEAEEPSLKHLSGYSSAWLERAVRDGEVAGSNPVTQTNSAVHVQVRFLVASVASMC